jgi:RNA-directed DNA polymerase
MRPEPPTFERIATFDSLVRAARRAARGHHRDADVAHFLSDIEREVLQLERELVRGVYRPAPWRTFRIRDPKPRTISAAAFRDRVVHHALCSAVEDTLEHDAHPASFACRVGGGVLRALHHTRTLVRSHAWALKLDILHFFESLDHAVLRRLLWRRVRDPDVRWLLDVFIDAGAPGSPPGKGLPIGNLTSQHFANFYLGPLDRHVARHRGAAGHARYMDDIVVVGKDKDELWDVHRSIDRFVRDRLCIELKAKVTRLAPVHEGVPFLGFVVWPSVTRFDPARRRRWYRKMNALQRGLDGRRCCVDDATRIASSLLGWSMHGDTLALRRAWARTRACAEC